MSQEILDVDVMNIEMDGTGKVEEAISEMALMCEQREHFAAIDHLVNHIEELHDVTPCHSKWIVHYTLATMNPNNLLDSQIRKTSVTLNVIINVHEWWLAAHQHFRKIIV